MGFEVALVPAGPGRDGEMARRPAYPDGIRVEEMTDLASALALCGLLLPRPDRQH
jgi:hypothetical protein